MTCDTIFIVMSLVMYIGVMSVGIFTSTAVLFCQIVTCDTIFIVMCLVMYIGEMSVGILPLLLSCSVRL